MSNVISPRKNAFTATMSVWATNFIASPLDADGDEQRQHQMIGGAADDSGCAATSTRRAHSASSAADHREAGDTCRSGWTSAIDRSGTGCEEIAQVAQHDDSERRRGRSSRTPRSTCWSLNRLSNSTTSRTTRNAAPARRERRGRGRNLQRRRRLRVPPDANTRQPDDEQSRRRVERQSRKSAFARDVPSRSRVCFS